MSLPLSETSPLVVAGKITVKVKYKAQECQLPIMIIVKADKVAPPIFGRPLLQVSKLDWPTIFSKGIHDMLLK